MADLCPISPIGPLVPPSLLGEDEDHDSGTVEMWKRDDTCIEWLRANQDGIVSNEEVEKCIREIMDGPKSVELKSNARELRVAAREAVAGAGSSDKNIQLFVDEIIRSCGSIVKGSCNDTS
ncbi:GLYCOSYLTRANSFERASE-RELATED [Salix koriyanagi]|uniref:GLYCOSYLTRANSFERASE-RELATED n=1 Tax=Salix koriyanagi TaxID=2511006 RepID=A0A9Q0TRM3_9ROSI|nr:GLYCOSYLTRANSFERASE-RELATED [Salix koriyanagi]